MQLSLLQRVCNYYFVHCPFFHLSRVRLHASPSRVTEEEKYAVSYRCRERKEKRDERESIGHLSSFLTSGGRPCFRQASTAVESVKQAHTLPVAQTLVPVRHQEIHNMQSHPGGKKGKESHCTLRKMVAFSHGQRFSSTRHSKRRFAHFSFTHRPVGPWLWV